jgi:hypothetical protein
MNDTATIDINAFDPSAARAEAVRTRMQGRLADSLRYIVQQAEGVIDLPRHAISACLDRLAHGAVSPQVFGAYCDLVLALDVDDIEESRRLLSEIMEAPNVGLGSTVMDLADPQMNASARRYRRLVDTDTEMPLTVTPPDAEKAAAVRGFICEAFALMDRGNKPLADEIRVILREIVLASGSIAKPGLTFDGVSTFMLWGAVVLNVGGYKSAIEMVQALAHESGHNLLFGLCAHGPLHENDELQRYESPLRTDHRPMDGIIHATYVTARMHQSVQRLYERRILDAEQREEVQKSNAANVRYFAGGMKTIDRYAKLTPLGKDVMGGALRYMAAYI